MLEMWYILWKRALGRVFSCVYSVEGKEGLLEFKPFELYIEHK
jgi:hypothetical protein